METAAEGHAGIHLYHELSFGRLVVFPARLYNNALADF